MERLQHGELFYYRIYFFACRNGSSFTQLYAYTLMKKNGFDEQQKYCTVFLYTFRGAFEGQGLYSALLKEINFGTCQSEKAGRVKIDDELLALKKQHKIRLEDVQKSSKEEIKQFEETIKKLNNLKPEQLQEELEKSNEEIQKIQSDSKVQLFHTFK